MPIMLENNRTDPHIRAIRLRDDLKQIADLIELCFSQNIDAEGKDYIKHIRQAANSYSSFLLENTTPENSSLPFHGYVWIENKQIIGNLTLIPLRSRDKGGYFVANVAVHPTYRGRGIARQLTQRAIQHVRDHQGKNIYLQVRDDNAAAIHLYQILGFEEFSRRTTWVYRPESDLRIPAHPQVKISRPIKEDWAQIKIWLNELYPQEIRWNIPFRLDKLEPSFSNWLYRLINGEMQRAFAAHKEGHLIGSVTLERSTELHDYCWLASSPVWEEEIVRVVLPEIIRRSMFPRRIMVNYPAGRATEAFKSVGMRTLNTLLWMKVRVHSLHESAIA